MGKEEVIGDEIKVTCYYGDYPPAPRLMNAGDIEKIPITLMFLFFCWPFGIGAILVGLIIPIIYIRKWMSEYRQQWETCCDSGNVLTAVNNEYLLSHGWYCNKIGEKPFQLNGSDLEKVKKWYATKKANKGK